MSAAPQLPKTALATRYLPSSGLSMFAKGRYAVKVRYRAGDDERVVEVVCARKPAAATRAIVYDPRNPARVWTGPQAATTEVVASGSRSTRIVVHGVGARGLRTRSSERHVSPSRRSRG